MRFGGDNAKKRKPWLGGYVRPGKKGPTYVIEKWIGGEHFHVSTCCRTERAALKHLEAFELDPQRYNPRQLADVRLQITKTLTDEFREYMVKQKKDTEEWADTVQRFLGDWTLDLAGKDLRRLQLADLKTPLAARKSQRHRIEAIKSFCTWLRREKGLLTTAEDRTQELPVPPVVEAKTHTRRVVPEQHILLTSIHLPDETRDVLTVQLGTSWHVSEVRRFAEGGEIRKPTNPVPGGAIAYLCTLHKSRSWVRQPVFTEEHLEAAQRVRARGRIPAKETLVDQLRAACDAVRKRQLEQGVPSDKLMPHWRLGSLRHTVLTFAVEHGATPAQASQIANHRSEVTTKKFYLDVSEPTVVVPVLRLVR